MAQMIEYDVRELSAAGNWTHRPVPILLTEGGEYLRPENNYLRQRASGLWADRSYVTEYGEAKERSDNSIRAYAKDLGDFVSYQECRGRYVLGGDPAGLLGEYRDDLLKGRWARAGHKVAKSTFDRRSATASDFTEWCRANGLIQASIAPHLDAAQRSAGARSHAWKRPGHGSCQKARPVRQDPEDLAIPDQSEVEAWLVRVYTRQGAARGSACDAILAAGFRLAETAALRAAQLPKVMPANMDWISIKITYGTKGGRVVGDADLKGKPRWILVHKTGLKRMLDYRDGPRGEAVAAFKANNPGKPPPKELFLDERTGNPLSVHTIYRAWTNCRAPIPMGWSPHVGRHYYAMGLALYHLSIEDDGQRLLGGRKRPRASLERVRFILEVIVQPSLGHTDTQTTMRYLRWLSRVAAGNGFGSAYAEYLDRRSSP